MTVPQPRAVPRKIRNLTREANGPWRIALASVLLIGLLPLCWNLTRPFVGHHEWNSAWYAYFARNHLRYGLGYTKGLCTHGLGPQPPAHPSWYLSHPPLIAIWTAAPLAIFGDHEWAARLVPIGATLGSAAILAITMRRLRGPAEGILTAGAFLALPATAYFGRMIDHLPVGLFFGLLALHGYLLWTDRFPRCGGPPGTPDSRQRRRGAALYTLGVLLGVGTAWAVVILAGLLWLWHFCDACRGRQRWGPLSGLTLCPVAAVGAVLAHMVIATGHDLGFLWALFATRSYGARPEMPIPITLWASRQAQYALSNFTWAGVLAIPAWLAIGLIRQQTNAPRGGSAGPFAEWPALWPILAWGALYVVVFKNQSFIHDYWQLLLAPGVALIVAAGLRDLATVARPMGAPLAGLAVGAPAVVIIALSARSLSDLHSRTTFPGVVGDVQMWQALGDLVPAGRPVMTYRNYFIEESFDGYTHRYAVPQAAYYSRREIVTIRRIEEIEANRVGAAAYVLETDPALIRRGRERIERFAQALRARYRTYQVGDHHLIALLDEPL